MKHSIGYLVSTLALVGMLEAPIANAQAQNNVYTGIVQSPSRIDIEPKHFRFFLSIKDVGVYTIRCYDPGIMDELEKKIRDRDRFEFRLENELTTGSGSCSDILDAINQN